MNTDRHALWILFGAFAAILLIENFRVMLSLVLMNSFCQI